MYEGTKVSKYNDKCLYKRHTGKDGGRDWSGAGTSQGAPGAPKSWKRQGGALSPRAVEGVRPCGHHGGFAVLKSRLRENRQLCLKPPNSEHFATPALGRGRDLATWPLQQHLGRSVLSGWPG